MILQHLGTCFSEKEEDVEEEDEIDTNQGCIVSWTFDRYGPHDMLLI